MLPQPQPLGSAQPQPQPQPTVTPAAKASAVAAQPQPTVALEAVQAADEPAGAGEVPSELTRMLMDMNGQPQEGADSPPFEPPGANSDSSGRAPTSCSLPPPGRLPPRKKLRKKLRKGPSEAQRAYDDRLAAAANLCIKEHKVEHEAELDQYVVDPVGVHMAPVTPPTPPSPVWDEENDPMFLFHDAEPPCNEFNSYLEHDNSLHPNSPQTPEQPPEQPPVAAEQPPVAAGAEPPVAAEQPSEEATQRPALKGGGGHTECGVRYRRV